MKLRNLLRPKAIIAGAFAAVVLALGVGTLAETAHATNGRDCDNNAIISCGYGYLGAGSDGFTTKFNKNASELQTIYGHFGFKSLSDFVNNAKHVTVYKNGTVKTDDGTVVATGANSLGRQSFGKSTRHPIKIGSKTYYYSTTQNSYASGTNSIDGYATFNSDDHSMIMGTMKACGNPFWGNSPGYKCSMLKQTKVNDTTYSYVATPYVKNGASVSKIVYDFGDGKSQTVTSNFGQTVSHTYAPGNYTAKATVYFNVNGSVKSDTRAECTKPVHVPQPPKPVFYCTQLVAKQVADSRTKFTFTATGHVENGAVLQSGTFRFDDGSTATVNASGNTVTVTHEYATTGDHTTKVDLTFNDGKDVGNTKCVANTTTTAPTCKDTPNKPECMPCEYNGNISKTSPECVPPCQYNNSIPGTSEDCKPPKTCQTNPEMAECQPPQTCATNPDLAECTKPLPSTGPEEVVSTVLGLSTLTGAGAYYQASRRNLLDRFFKR